MIIPIDYNFERVDIFLRVNGRLPNEDGDSITQELLDKYCEMYEKGELTKGVVPLKHMYDLIKGGKISTTEQILESE